MEGEPCRFCAIVRGDAEAEVVYEDSSHVAFLDNRPLQHGHVLLVTRDHHETLNELPDELVGPTFANARLLAGAVEDAMGAQGTFVALNNKVSQSVPHLHLHIVPRRRKDGLRGFFWPRHTYESDRHMREVRDAIRAEVASMLRE